MKAYIRDQRRYWSQPAIGTVHPSAIDLSKQRRETVRVTFERITDIFLRENKSVSQHHLPAKAARTDRINAERQQREAQLTALRHEFEDPDVL